MFLDLRISNQELKQALPCPYMATLDLKNLQTLELKERALVEETKDVELAKEKTKLKKMSKKSTRSYAQAVLEGVQTPAEDQKSSNMEVLNKERNNLEEQTGSEGIQDSQGPSVIAEVGSRPTSSGTAGGHSSQPGGQDGPQMEELSS